jgi:hypothetical protein
MDYIFSKYSTDDYLKKNPTWDIEDSPWKAKNVLRLISSIDLKPSSICEVGCGAGAILAELRPHFQGTEIFGFDIAPDAAAFWNDYTNKNIKFYLGDFFELNVRRYDVLLLLDVIEHLQNPFEFLSRLRDFADYFIFHIPLDLSAITVLREMPLLHARNKVGHVYYFTKQIAISLIKECNYDILKCQYTGASMNAPNRSLKTKLANIPRSVVGYFNKDWSVRLFGGETLMVLAKAGAN